MKIQHSYALIGLLFLFFTACQNSDNKKEGKNKTNGSYELEAKFKNLPTDKSAYLLHIYGEDLLIIDTLKANSSSEFAFSFDNKLSIGMYRFLIDSEKYIDFIFNNENIVFSADYQNIGESLIVEASLETKLYYEYREQAIKSEFEKAQASQMLQQTKKSTSETDKEVLTIFNEAQEKYQKVVQNILSQHSDTYVSKIIRFSQIPSTDLFWGEIKRNEFLQQKMLANFDFSDTSLLHSSTVAKSIVNYLSLYVADYMSVAEQETAFMAAADALLSKAKKENGEVYAFVLEYLLQSFGILEADKVLKHIAQNYDLNEGCNNAEKTRFIQDKLANIKLFGLGKQVPNIELFDEKGIAFELKEKTKMPTLLIFWASWCEHCTQILPQIKKLYEQQENPKKWEVIAVSLDEDKAVWQAFIADGKYSWFNSCDFNAWEGESIKKLHLYATPTMYWLDKELIIKDLPKNIADIKKHITSL
ncbi:MAG: thioredoxin-like domain-containing protein [Chitinophagales bacterium]